ncbi:5-hydroxytryptamine receptor 1B-like [Paramacrobiotus metropolitanus]|uniref:5-hydroxytryptamine receptor 1B-like n=1 Tax=Paramacrobiotus metropolitanus TaxID=2943436 RepID=UPI0024457AE1|nr:5-hydroxytryptamine receptor 1B-like [Paramacrobiotus metropolitanus]
MVLSIGLNVGMAVYYWFSLRITPFSVYLIVLFITNALYSAVCPPLEIARDLYGGWWMGHWVCNFYNYFEFVISLGPLMLHALIAVSRIWAVAHPLSYKCRHTYKMAFLLSGLGFCYAHLVDVPGYALDMLYYHIPEKEFGCQMHTAAVREWSRAEVIVGRLSPLLFILLSYVYVNVTIWLRKRRRTGIFSTRSYEMNSVPGKSLTDTNPKEAAAGPLI